MNSSVIYYVRVILESDSRGIKMGEDQDLQSEHRLILKERLLAAFTQEGSESLVQNPQLSGCLDLSTVCLTHCHKNFDQFTKCSYRVKGLRGEVCVYLGDNIFDCHVNLQVRELVALQVDQPKCLLTCCLPEHLFKNVF
jgi:hypothetical protein